MTGFVLNLGHQLQFALEAWGTGNPVAFGQHADDFRVGVLGDLPDEGLAVGLGHPVLGFDLDFGVDLFLEVAFLGDISSSVLTRLTPVSTSCAYMCCDSC